MRRNYQLDNVAAQMGRANQALHAIYATNDRTYFAALRNELNMLYGMIDQAEAEENRAAQRVQHVFDAALDEIHENIKRFSS